MQVEDLTHIDNYPPAVSLNRSLESIALFAYLSSLSQGGEGSELRRGLVSVGVQVIAQGQEPGWQQSAANLIFHGGTT